MVRYSQLLTQVACLLCCTCATVTVTSVNRDEVMMMTSLGNVTGTVVPGGGAEVEVNIFKGIAFAKPPVGDLRFKAPEPADQWGGSRNATKLPNSCWQTFDNTFPNFTGSGMWNPNTPMSEDCLYLNAWVPTTTTNKAIMVWIFGGGFWSGTTTLIVYDALKMAARHDVIVVSIAYRLGPFGFMYSGKDSIPGNAGMLDQVMALQWVRDNAANMGGDPSRITLFGESAGAASIGYHLLSPLSRDLFNNGIMMSASSLVNWGIQSLRNARTRFEVISKNVGCSGATTDKMVACLRKVDALALANGQWDVVTGGYFDAPFDLVVDNHFLPQHPEKLVKNGMIKDADIIAGVVKNEGIYWLLYGFPDVFPKKENISVNRTQFMSVMDGVLQQYFMASNERKRYLVEDFHDDDENDNVNEKRKKNELIKKLTVLEYFDGVSPSDRSSYLDTLDEISGDIVFKCPVRDYCSKHRSYAKGNVYMYSFEHRVSNNPWPSWLGVAHGYEIELVMGLPFLKPELYTKDERALSDRVMAFFTNFAKDGNPNDNNTAVGANGWPAFELDTQIYHRIDIVDQNDEGLRYGPCKFWSELVPLVERALATTGSSDTTDPNGTMRLTVSALPCFMAAVVIVLYAHISKLCS